MFGAADNTLVLLLSNQIDWECWPTNSVADEVFGPHDEPHQSA